MSDVTPIPPESAAIVFNEDGHLDLLLPCSVDDESKGEEPVPGHIFVAAALASAMMKDEKFSERILREAAEIMMRGVEEDSKTEEESK